MDYVKDGTLTIQARTIKEVNSIDRVVVYADGCQREYLMPLPTIEERKEGHWIEQPPYKPFIDDETEIMVAPKCSVCGRHGSISKYCPNCGAKMKGE